MYKSQAIEKIITRANHPPTLHFPPVREREVNPSQGQHNSVPLVFINTLGWRETAWSEVTCPRTQGAFTYYSGQASILSYWKLQTLHLKGQNLPPSVVMSQYALIGCPLPFGSIQYSPFFCALVYFQMSLQETPGKSGDKPFLTDRREERSKTDMTPLPKEKYLLSHLRSLRNKRNMRWQTYETSA